MRYSAISTRVRLMKSLPSTRHKKPATLQFRAIEKQFFRLTNACPSTNRISSDLRKTGLKQTPFEFFWQPTILDNRSNSLFQTSFILDNPAAIADKHSQRSKFTIDQTRSTDHKIKRSEKVKNTPSRNQITICSMLKFMKITIRI